MSYQFQGKNGSFSSSVTWHGREVQNPVMRWVVAGYVVVVGLASALLAFLWSVLFAALLLAFTPGLIPLHFVLRAIGRKGFVQRAPGKVYFTIDKRAFRRVS